jgi:threonine synthase
MVRHHGWLILYCYGVQPVVNRSMKHLAPSRFYLRCLICNNPCKSPGYNCSCGGKHWTREYRVLDLNYSLPEHEKAVAVRAIEQYDLSHPSGILQYYFTPHSGYIGQIGLKVGLTPFIALEQMGEQYGARIFIKNEGDNPSGCFKDRETVMAALNSLANGKKKAVIYSSGNAAASASLFAAHLGIQLITCVAGNTARGKTDFIRNTGSDVIQIGNRKTTFEDGYRLFAEMNAGGTFHENGFDNWSVINPYRVPGDKTSAIEIQKQYEKTTGIRGSVPGYVVVPTGNGSCLVGIWRGFKELKHLGIIGNIPKMVSAAIKNASPVYKAWQQHILSSPAVCDPDKMDEGDKEIGSTIVAEEGYDSIEATKAVIESGGFAIEATKNDIHKALIDLMCLETGVITQNAVLPEPASLVTLAAIKKMKNAEEIEGTTPTVVAFISGHGFKAKDLLIRMLGKRPDLQQQLLLIIEKRKNTIQVNGQLPAGRLIHVKDDLTELKNTFRQLSNALYAG